MKTITLSESAYRRLLAWKVSPHDSFSSIVLRVVPKNGTLGQLLKDIQQLPPLSERQARVMEETVQWGRNSTFGLPEVILMDYSSTRR